MYIIVPKLKIEAINTQRKNMYNIVTIGNSYNKKNMYLLKITCII